MITLNFERKFFEKNEYTFLEQEKQIEMDDYSFIEQEKQILLIDKWKTQNINKFINHFLNYKFNITLNLSFNNLNENIKKLLKNFHYNFSDDDFPNELIKKINFFISKKQANDFFIFFKNQNLEIKNKINKILLLFLDFDIKNYKFINFSSNTNVLKEEQVFIYLLFKNLL